MKNLLRSRRARALFALAFAVSLISGLFVAGPITASAQTALSQCNGTDNVGGQAVECHYTVTNTLDGDVTSSTVQLTECHGAANDPPTLVCTSSTVTSAALVTSIDQCNGSGNGGGGTVTCSVDVVNNITSTVTPTAATVNQCNASGTGGGTQPTILCNPYPANTTNATVTQCNESGTGGGGTLRVRCTVTSDSTTTPVLSVFVNQCNGSGNGGGATVVCSTSLTDNVRAPVQPEPEPTAVVPPLPSTTPLPVATATPVDVPTSRPAPDASENPELDENKAMGGPGGGGGTSVQGGRPTGGIDTTGQVTQVPTGGAAAGGGSTSGLENINLLALAFTFLGAALFSLQVRSLIRTES